MPPDSLSCTQGDTHGVVRVSRLQHNVHHCRVHGASLQAACYAEVGTGSTQHGHDYCS